MLHFWLSLCSDYDMESVTSMMSVSANDGVRNLDDDEIYIIEHSTETSAQLSELTNKFLELTNVEDTQDKEPIGNKMKGQCELQLCGAKRYANRVRFPKLLLLWSCDASWQSLLL